MEEIHGWAAYIDWDTEQERKAIKEAKSKSKSGSGSRSRPRVIHRS